jgi:hypothetical protein
MILDAVLWYQALTMLMLEERRGPDPFFQQAIEGLLMRVSQDAMVIRNLIRDGYDAQAKNILRSLDEHADAIYYLCLRPETSEEFVRADDDKSANHFWHRHIKRSRNVIDDAIQKLVKTGVNTAELSVG